MADKRKLQIDVEKTIKKVNEGRQIFSETLTKFEAACTPSQKEKVEIDLKKEIKKLQRYREQIKNWLINNDIKEKVLLQECRRGIESDMEHFKQIEKLAKTKAYSKEGLVLELKKDPHELDKDYFDDWFKEIISKLTLQVEQVEFAISGGSPGGIKRSLEDEGFIESQKEKLQELRSHIDQCESCLRSLHNDNINFQKLKKNKGDIEYYANDSNHFVDVEVYDKIIIDRTLVEAEPFQHQSPMKPIEEISPSILSEKNPDKASALFNCTISSAKKSSSIAERRWKPTADADNDSSIVESPYLEKVLECSGESILSATPLNSGGGGSALINSSTVSNPSPIVNASSPKLFAPTANLPTGVSFNGWQHNPLKSSNLSLPASSHHSTQDGQLHHSFNRAMSLDTANRPPSMATTTTHTAVHSSNYMTINPSSPLPSNDNHPHHNNYSVFSHVKNDHFFAQQQQSRPRSFTNFRESALSTNNYFVTPLPTTQTHASDEVTSAREVSSFSLSREKALVPFASSSSTASSSDYLENLEKLLNIGYKRMAIPEDANRARLTLLKLPPSYETRYPQEPLPDSHTEEYYSKLDVSTLFFIFYYFEGSRAQYLASRALKRKSWRFHKLLQLWFQRLEEPKTKCEDSESGAFAYWDVHSKTQQKYDDFKFEYSQLEDFEST